jgi:hypothetical protein
VDHSVDGYDSKIAISSVQQAATSFADLNYHPVVCDAFIPTKTRAGRITEVAKKFLQMAVTADQLLQAVSSLKPAKMSAENGVVDLQTLHRYYYIFKGTLIGLSLRGRVLISWG